MRLGRPTLDISIRYAGLISNADEQMPIKQKSEVFARDDRREWIDRDSTRRAADSQTRYAQAGSEEPSGGLGHAMLRALS